MLIVIIGAFVPLYFILSSMGYNERKEDGWKVVLAYIGFIAFGTFFGLFVAGS